MQLQKTAHPTKKPFLPLLVLFLLATYPQTALSTVIEPFEIKDLETTGQPFICDAAAWTHTSLYWTATGVHYICGTTYLLGGHGILNNDFTNGAYFQRIYSDLPSHTRIYFTFDLWILDSVDDTDIVYIELDSLYFPIWTSSAYNIATSPLCGYIPHYDVGKVRYFGSIAHTAPSITFRVGSKMDTYTIDESVGLRNVNLLFSSNPFPSVNTVCGKSVTYPVDGHDCGCPEGTYKTSSGSCAPCHCSCASCFGPSKRDCYQCKPNYPYTGTACSSINDSCLTCDTSGNGILDIDESCRNCQEMIVEYVQALSDGHQYNLTLLPAACALSQQAVQAHLKGVPSSGILSLPVSFRVFKLSGNHYLVDLPLHQSVLKRTEIDVSLSYLRGTMIVPKKFLSSLTFPPALQYIIIALLGISLVGTSLIGATGLMWSIISLQQFIIYLRYINIEYPPPLDLFFSILDIINWSSLPNLLAAVTESSYEEALQQGISVKEHLPPQKFVRDNMTSFFIENGGVIFLIHTLLWIVLGVTLLLKEIPSLANSQILRVIKVKLRWNGIARIFLITGIPLMLAIFLQLRTLSFEPSYFVVCNVFTFICCVYFLAMCLFLGDAILSRENYHLNKVMVRRLLGTLYEGVVLEEEEDTIGQFYHLIIFFRCVLLISFIVFLETAPLFQIVPLILVNLALIRLLFKKRVLFTNTNHNIMNKVKEITIMICELCIACLSAETETELYYQVLAWIVIVGLGTVYIFEFGYMIVFQLINIKLMANNLVKCFGKSNAEDEQPQATQTKKRRLPRNQEQSFESPE